MISFLNGAKPVSFERDKQLEFCHEFLNNLLKEVERLEQDNLNYAKQVTILKNRTESEHVQKLQDKIKQLTNEVDNLYEQVYMGFTKEDEKKASEWYLEHQPKPLGKYKQRHYYTWIITPTGSGLIKSVNCSCGAKLDLTKIDEFG